MLTEAKFRCQPGECNKIRFSGVQIMKTNFGIKELETGYILKPREVPKEDRHSNYRSLRAKFLYGLLLVSTISVVLLSQSLDSQKNDLRKIIHHL